jgi:hypothetical protein
VDGECQNVGACTKRAVRRGLISPPQDDPNLRLPWVTGSISGSVARYVGESNVRSMARELRTLRGQVEHAAVAWNLTTGDELGAAEFQAFAREVIAPALKYLDNAFPTEQMIRHRGRR